MSVDLAETTLRPASRFPRAAEAMVLIPPLAAGLFIWVLFYPGLMTADSFYQYRQAVTGSYDDWHPPFLAILLHGFLKMGGGIQTMTLVQCVAGTAGILALCRAVFENVRPTTPWITSLMALALILIPPLPFYLAVFWKDTWLLIAFLWLYAALIALSKNLLQSRSHFFLGVAVVVVASVLAGLVRHNMTVVPLFAGIALFLLARKKGIRHAAVAAVIPLGLFFMINETIYHMYDVKRTNMIVGFQAIELVALCHTHPELRENFPYTRAYLLSKFPTDHPPGGSVERFFQRSYFPGPTFENLFDPSRIRREYGRAWNLAAPVMMEIKLVVFRDLLSMDRTFLWRASEIMPDDFGIQIWPSIRALRDRISGFADSLLQKPLLRFLLGSHWPWMVVAIVQTLRTLIRDLRSSGDFVHPLLWSMLLAAYLSFLPFTATPDFRYLYPMTFTVQTLTAAGMLRRLARARPQLHT